MSLLSNLPQPCLVARLLCAAAAAGRAAGLQTAAHRDQDPSASHISQNHSWFGLVCYQQACLPCFSRGHLADPLASHHALLQVFPYVSGCISDYMTILFSPLWSGILASLLLMMLRSCLLRRDKPLHQDTVGEAAGLCRAVPGCPFHLGCLWP